MSAKVLLVFAQKAEAKKTIEMLGASPIHSETTSIWGEGKIPCLYTFKHGWIALSGLGVMAAQMAVAKYSKEASEVWNIGLAGRLRGDIPLGTLLSVGRVGKYVPYSNIDLKSQEMAQMIHPIVALDLANLSLVSSDFPIHDDHHRKALLENYDLVDMEGYGIAYATLFLGKKCRMWKIVSDFAAPGGRDLIQNNKDLLSEYIADHILNEMSCNCYKWNHDLLGNS